jgi:hypothetical protein
VRPTIHRESLLAQGLISQIAADRSSCRTALEIDNDPNTTEVAFKGAGARDDEEFESPARAGERPRAGTTAAPLVASPKTQDDGY